LPELPTGTITFLFTDIADITTRWDLHRQSIEAQQGHVFGRPRDAVRAACASLAETLPAARPAPVA
jgi:hypothetical protein